MSAFAYGAHRFGGQLVQVDAALRHAKAAESHFERGASDRPGRCCRHPGCSEPNGHAAGRRQLDRDAVFMRKLFSVLSWLTGLGFGLPGVCGIAHLARHGTIARRPFRATTAETTIRSSRTDT
jgi:hypothetical protein